VADLTAQEALERIRDNALSWHGPVPEDSGHARALAVIAQWCDDALASLRAATPETTLAEAYERGMTCKRCGQYGDGCMCSTRDKQLSHDPTQRAEAATTPEGAKGWVDQAGSAQVLAGGHGLDVAPDASPEGVRAEARREQDGGGKPSNAPNAAAPAAPDAPMTDDLCDHGCGDDATVQHADGRMLCYPCYRTETGGDNERDPGCPTCSPAAAPDAPAEERA